LSAVDSSDDDARGGERETRARRRRSAKNTACRKPVVSESDDETVSVQITPAINEPNQ